MRLTPRECAGHRLLVHGYLGVGVSYGGVKVRSHTRWWICCDARDCNVIPSRRKGATYGFPSHLVNARWPLSVAQHLLDVGGARGRQSLALEGDVIPVGLNLSQSLLLRNAACRASFCVKTTSHHVSCERLNRKRPNDHKCD